MREFTTAVQSITEAQEWIEFKVRGPGPEDERICRAVAQPADGQVAYLIARSGRHVNTTDKVSAYLNFFDSALDDESSAYFADRLLDPQDPFGIPDVQDVLEWLMEEWSGRPTQRSSGSTSSPPSSGPTSTPPPPPPTSYGSPSTASVTTSSPGSGIALHQRTESA